MNASVSMGDVARLAGVSAQTVSRVARGEPSVRPQTAERVRLAMQQLGYVPNRVARALRYGSFRTVGVVGHRIARTGEAHIIEVIIEALRVEDYSVMLIDTPSARAEDSRRGVQHAGKVGRRHRGAAPGDAVARRGGAPAADADRGGRLPLRRSAHRGRHGSGRWYPAGGRPVPLDVLIAGAEP